MFGSLSHDRNTLLSSSHCTMAPEPTQESPSCRPAKFTSKGAVFIMQQGRKVGSAVLMPPAHGRESEIFSRYMHGQPLSNYARPREELVAITNIVIESNAKNLKYHYRYGGIESPPTTLGELHTGIHSWDLREMVPASGEAGKVRSRSGTRIASKGRRLDLGTSVTGVHRPCGEDEKEQQGGELEDVEVEGKELLASPATLEMDKNVEEPQKEVRKSRRLQVKQTASRREEEPLDEIARASSDENSSEDSEYTAGKEEDGKVYSRRDRIEADRDNLNLRQKRKYNYISRVPKGSGEQSDLASKRQRIASSLTAESLKDRSCCTLRQCFQMADHNYLQAQVARILTMNQADRKLMLQRMLNPRIQKFSFNGREVCASFLEQSFGFSRYLQARVKGTAGSVKVYDTMKEDRRHDSNQRDSVICYLDRFSESVGDSMPDRNETHLPYFRKEEVYNDFCKEFEILNASNRAAPPQSYFYVIWQEHCSHIKVRKQHRFTKCGDCERLREALEDRTTDLKGARALREKKKQHNEMVARERREYLKKCQKAVLYPNDYCSIVVDGADQTAYGLPHFRVKVKEQRGHAMTVKLIGVLEHGTQKRISLFLMTDQYETGANHIIEVIHRHLSVRVLSAPLPRTLFVQLDNCHRENKNQFIFAYFECLVAWGVVCEVFVSFLPIGHTHCDIDQVFSRTSIRLKQHDAVTMEEMVQELRKSYTPEPHVVHMKGVINFSALCARTKCTSTVTGFTSYRYFHFARHPDGSSSQETFFKTTCSVRTDCTEDWVPLRQRNKEGFLKHVPDLSQTPPTKVTSPTNLSEVNRRFMSDEARITQPRLLSLQKLRDEVYKSQDEPFHWKLDECLEMNGRYTRSGTDASDGESTESGGVVLSLGYERNEFVAVRNNLEDRNVRFWIARVLDTIKNENGRVTRLKVRWYELYRGTSALKGKYKPSDIDRKKGREPWVVEISVNAVIHRFSSLTTGKELRTVDQKSIWQSLN